MGQPFLTVGNEGLPQGTIQKAVTGQEGATSERFSKTRSLMEALVAPLSDADATIQSMEDASPAKWHLAHTTWFWETFLLRDHAPGYALYDQDWPFLFNSYYEAEGARLGRFSRGMLSRPTLEEIGEWRAHVTRAMEPLLDNPAHADLIELGIAHEQQHIELLLTDIKHALFQNPLGVAMWEGGNIGVAAPETGWHQHPGGMAQIGHSGDGFAFDNEGPVHRALLEPFALAESLITNREWDEFVEDGGYETPSLWLSDGLAWVRENQITAPLYWQKGEHFTHQGWQPRDPNACLLYTSDAADD